jgi:hypothetical protein
MVRPEAGGGASNADDGRGSSRSRRSSRRFVSGTRNFERLLAKLPEVDLVTTPSEALADRFEVPGAPTTEVIDDYLLDQFVGANL